VKKKRILAVSIILLFFAVVWSIGWARNSCASELKLVSTFEGGKLYKTDNKFDVLELEGTYRQMGRQYGKLLAKQLRKLYEIAINERLIKKENISLKDIKQLTKPTFNLYPRRIKEIVYGMSEASGMSVDEINALNQLASLIVIFKKDVYCSGIAAWADYTAGGPLVFGRNFDYPPYFKEFAKFLTIVVYKPQDGANYVATIGYAGGIETLNAMNDAGLFVEINDGCRAGGKIFSEDRAPFIISPLTFLLDYSTLEQLGAAIDATRANYALLLNIADKNAAYSYECTIFGVRRRKGINEGLLVATNHFVDSSWNIAKPPLSDPSLTLQRRENLLALGEKYKGKINVKTMQKIMDTTIEKGGATEPDDTIYQIVAVPQQLKVWFKGRGYSDWVEIDLGPLFEKGTR